MKWRPLIKKMSHRTVQKYVKISRKNYDELPILIFIYRSSFSSLWPRISYSNNLAVRHLVRGNKSFNKQLVLTFGYDRTHHVPSLILVCDNIFVYYRCFEWQGHIFAVLYVFRAKIKLSLFRYTRRQNLEEHDAIQF